MERLETLQQKNITLPKWLIAEVIDLVEFANGLGFESNFSSMARKCISKGLIEVANDYEQYGILNGKIKKEELE